MDDRVMRLLFTLGTFALIICSCEDINPDEGSTMDVIPPTTDAGLSTSTESWESQSWNEPWQPYRGRHTLSFEHNLGRTPHAVLLYIAFDESGTGSALAAGDLARIVEVNDTHVSILNDTDGHYYCRLVLL